MHSVISIYVYIQVYTFIRYTEKYLVTIIIIRENVINIVVDKPSFII